MEFNLKQQIELTVAELKAGTLFTYCGHEHEAHPGVYLKLENGFVVSLFSYRLFAVRDDKYSTADGMHPDRFLSMKPDTTIVPVKLCSTDIVCEVA